MKENKFKATALHLASVKGNEGIVKLLLNAFDDEKETLIKYLMQGDKDKYTALHIASFNGQTGIVKLLLNAFSAKEKDKLSEYVYERRWR